MAAKGEKAKVAAKTGKSKPSKSPVAKVSARVPEVKPVKRGRPSKNTPELQREIYERLSKGEPLTVICSDEHMPCDDTVRAWADSDAGFARDIAHARTRGFDSIAWDAKRIADTPLEGEETTVKPDGSIEVKRGDMLGHRKLQIETRLKLLAKWDPKRYGEKLAIGGAEDLPAIQSVHSMSTEALLAIAGQTK